MVAFEVHGDPHEVIAGVRLITPAVSLGSVDTPHPAPGLHQPPHRGRGGPARRRASSDRLLRMSVGLEDVEDLWADLDGALGDRAEGWLEADAPGHRPVMSAGQS